MKNKKSIISNTKAYPAVALFMLTLAIFAAAQPENFRVGDTVETSDGRVCKILSITGRSAKVSCGANRSDLRVYSFESMTSRAAAEAKREQEERQKQGADNTPRTTATVFNQGDTVKTPDGRTGKIESFKTDEMAKVQFAQNETQYFMVKDLIKIEPPKPDINEPVENFRVGDTVVNKSNQKLRIDSIKGDSAVVRYGAGKYNVYSVKLAELVGLETWERRQNEENEGKLVRAQFEDETQRFLTRVQNLAHAYNPKYPQQGEITMDDNPAVFENWRKELEELAAICRKYPNLTNSAYSSEPPYDAEIKNHPADWCKLAEQRTAVILKTRMTGYAYYAAIEIKRFGMDIDEAMKSADGTVSDEVQMLLFDRAAWEQKNLQATRKRFAGIGAVLPPELLKPLDEKAAELKAKIEQDVLDRSWTPPNFKDAALEALGRREIQTDFPGAKVFKTGMTYSTWEARDTTTYVGSDSKFRFYRITPGAYRYKRGLVLVQLPNRPFCQIREFQVTQYKAGAGYGAAKASGSLAGIFVKCP